MFSYKKTEKYFSELENKKSYDTENIYKQLRKDSFGKCYMCGEYQGSSRSERVEHFIPHEDGKYNDLKYDWSNLLFCCDHCNNRKSSTYNKIGEDRDILNPIKDNVETEIIQFYDSKEINDIKIIIEIIGLNSKNENTKELLEKIYNGDLYPKNSFATKSKSKTLKKNISNEIYEFMKEIEELALSDLESYEEEKIIKKIKVNISKESNFYEFKIGLIEKNIQIKKLLQKRKVM